MKDFSDFERYCEEHQDDILKKALNFPTENISTDDLNISSKDIALINLVTSRLMTEYLRAYHEWLSSDHE